MNNISPTLMGMDSEAEYPVKEPRLDFNQLVLQLNKYTRWYQNIGVTRQGQDNGKWIKSRIQHYCRAIAQDRKLNREMEENESTLFKPQIPTEQ